MQTIYLDISNKGVIPAVYAKQGDVGRKFLVVLTDSGIPYTLPTGSVFSVWYEGDSGEGNYTDIGEQSAFSINENAVTVEMIEQMLSVAGNGILCLTLNKADGGQIGSWNIPYVCERIPGFESEEATSYYTAFSEAVKNLQNLVETDPTVPNWAKSPQKPVYTASEVGARANTWLPTIKEIGAAPSGYGYGGYPITINTNILNSEEELNSALEEIYSATNNGETKLIRFIGYPSGSDYNWFGFLFKSSANYGSILLQSAYTKGCLISKVRASGAWQPIEWINPPMNLGVEYRTTERWNGEAVYAQLVDLGTTTETFSATVTIDGITRLIRAVPILNDSVCTDWDASAGFNSINAFYFYPEKSANSVAFRAKCASARTGNNLKAQIWYTKD